MTTEEIWLLVGLIVTASIFITFTIITRRINNTTERLNEILHEKTKEYITNFNIEDNKYFPYVEDYFELVKFKFSKKNSIRKCDYLGIELPKHYTFVKNKSIYIINNKLKSEDFIAVDVNGIKKMELSSKIKTIDIIFIFFYNHSMCYRYKISHNNNIFAVESVEEIKAEDKKEGK